MIADLILHGSTNLLHLGNPLTFLSENFSRSIRLQLTHAIFKSLQRLIWVQAQALTGSLKDIHRLFLKAFLHCLGWLIQVIAVLEDEHLEEFDFGFITP